MNTRFFQSIKDRISEDTILAVPSTDYPFHIHVDSSNVGTGCILIQKFPEGKRIISLNSRVFDKAEQKMPTLHRELCGIVSALQTYSVLMGTQKATLPSILSLSGYHHKVSELENYWDTWIKPCLS